MWKVLGKKAFYVELGNVWKEEMMAIASKMECGERFNAIFGPAKVTHLFNGSTMFHTFDVELPEDIPADDIQFLADAVLDIANADLDRYFVSLEDKYQPCQVVFSGIREPEILGLNKTEGYGSGNVFMPIVQSLSQPGRRNESQFQ